MSISALYPFQATWKVSQITIPASGNAVVFSTASATNPIGMYLIVLGELPGDGITNQGIGSQIQIMLNLNRTGATNAYEVGWTVGTTYANSGAIPANMAGVVVGTNALTIYNTNASHSAQFNVVIYKLL